MEITEQEIVTFELPLTLTAKNVIYYSHHAKQVVGNVRDKAKRIVSMNLIEWSSNDKCFYCNPIPGYNHTRYKIEKIGKGFECDCQACHNKIKNHLYNPITDTTAACSHILAVYFYLKIKNWTGRQEVQNESD